MSIFGNIAAQAGSKFLDSMASQHGSTLASRLARPYQDFETPWGKGPYWTGQTQAEAQTWKYDALMASAKKHGIHKLYAMGTGPSISGGPVRAGTRGPQHGGGGMPRTITEAEKLERAARVRNLDAQADLYRSQAAKFRQAPGGDPGASFGGEGTIVSKLPEGRAIQRRPLVEHPRQSIPERVELIDQSGRRIMTLNPDAGLDEVGQAEYLRQKAIQAVSDLLLDRKKKVRAKRKRDKERYRRSDYETYGGS